MSDLTLGVDVSDAIARLAIVSGDGDIAAQGIVSAIRAGAIKEALAGGTGHNDAHG